VSGCPRVRYLRSTPSVLSSTSDENDQSGERVRLWSSRGRGGHSIDAVLPPQPPPAMGKDFKPKFTTDGSILTPHEYADVDAKTGEGIQQAGESIKIDVSGLVPRHTHQLDPTILAKKTPRSPLLEELQNAITMRGPMTVDEYMREVLTHPKHGYYSANVKTLGEGGDFTTAPEVSQMFGELVGVWCADAWLSRGQRPIRLVELGPGHGSLMADALRATRNLAGFHSSIQSVHLVEVSSEFKQQQQAALRRALGPDLGGLKVEWHANVNEVPRDANVPSIFLLQEFLDVLPVRHFKKTELGWCEVLVDVDSTAEGEHHLRFVLSRGPTPAARVFTEGHPSWDKMPEGLEYLEASPESWALAQKLAEWVSDTDGAALMVDYGHDGAAPYGGSLRGLLNHQFCSPLQQPGEVDVTVDVDFASIRDAVDEIAGLQAAESKVTFHGPIWQRDFLANMGIVPRFEALVKHASPEQATKLKQGLIRLMDTKEGMGKLYKAAAIVPKKYKAAGF